MLQFVHWRGLFEVFDHLRILGDITTVESEGIGGHLLHRGGPALVSPRFRTSSPRERFQAGCNHDLEVPFREHGIGIFPVENFALLRDANLAGKIANRLGQNSGMSGATTASHRAAPAVKKAELHVALAR